MLSIVTNKPSIQVDLAPEFVRRVKQLLKRYPHAYEDAQALITQLEKGETPGDQVPGVKYTVYKVRVKNSDVPKGKSGGYRVIYYLKTSDRVILITIYAKTQQVDMRPEQIRQMIEGFEESDR